MANDWAYILKLMRGGESDQVKFFGRLVTDQLLGSVISGMANSNGGLIIIGIDVVNYHLVGSPVDINWVNKAVLSQLEPNLSIRIDRIKRDEKELIVIHVPLGADPPFRFQGQIFVRDGIVTREATSVEELELKPRAFAKIAAQSHEFWLLHPPEALDEHRSEENDGMAEEEPVGSRTPLLVELVPDPVVTDQHISNGDSEIVAAAPEKPLTADEVTIKVEPILSGSDSTITLNSRQKQAISFLKANGTIKNMEYRNLYQVSHKTAHLELVDLVAHGYLDTQGKGRSTCYVLSSSSLDMGGSVAAQTSNSASNESVPTLA